jgi:microsomal dipeptidase-like Zn-dependent dipeptidase
VLTFAAVKRRVVVLALVAIAAGGAYVFGVLPSRVAADMNPVLSPPYKASAEARQLHETLVIADLHADTLLWDRDVLDRSPAGHVDVPRLIEGNVALQMFTIVTKVPSDIQLDGNDPSTDAITLLSIAQLRPFRAWRSLTARALDQAAALHDAAARSGGKLTVIQDAGELQRYVTARSHNVRTTAGVLGIEGAHALEGNPRNVDRLFDAGVRMIGLAHLADNEVGGSAQGVVKSGLSEYGKALIRRMESKEVLIDLAHASARTFEDAAAIATRPLVVSHTGVRGTCDNARNLSDEQVRAVASTGGVIGIGFWETATCGRNAAAIARAIRYIVDVAGIAAAGLGSDFDGAVATPFDAAGLSLVTDALIAEGFSASEIRAIMGGNITRVLAQTLPAPSPR